MDFEESKLNDIICHGFIYEYNLKKKRSVKYGRASD